MKERTILKLIFSQLKFPAGLNLHLLADVLSEKEFRNFIVKCSREKRINRRIILPSHKCIKKVFFHYIWDLVEKQEISWSEVKRDFRRDFMSLKEAKISKKEIIKLYNQRKKEILMEKMKKQKGK